MGAWYKAFARIRLVFAGNGSDQTAATDLFSDVSEKIKRHVACLPQRAFQARRATRPEREVLIEI